MFKFLLFIPIFLQAQMIETSKIEDVYGAVEEGTVVLIDMDSTLTESSMSLGSSSWRHYLRDQGIPAEIKDRWTYEIACRVPVKAVDEAMVEWIGELQEKGIPALCLTARGRYHWHSLRMEGVDALTEKQLKTIGVDFSKSNIPEALQTFNPDFYSRGVFYSYTEDKGAFLMQVLDETGYEPTKIIFIDDKESQVKAVEAALTKAQIPHLCVWYKKNEENVKNYQPLLANVQFNYFLEHGVILTEEEAADL